ncbi:dienelactone hydrolase family protein [Podospora didyma]|uniref:Dienelactone hydrolase family protein n=1 Tax=Podospora didyma TaxID=330526 RepID=A0AAE0K6G9_9PEZI|nr:dienelactone hydrolase family protein [Podospora didyma]
MASSDPSLVSNCCLRGFQWDGTPTGSVTTITKTGNSVYVTGTNKSAGVMLIHDLFGWTFANTRLLADHIAREANVTVYVPDFFGGNSLPVDLLLAGRWGEMDVRGFVARNNREIREPEIFGVARNVRAIHDRVGAIGFCYGGWATFRLGAKEHLDANGRGLVDCISVGHPSLLTTKDIDEVAVPVQMLAPEFDHVYTAELKMHTFETLQKAKVPFDFQFYPGVEHACFIRGDPDKKGERDAMTRGKNAAVAWLKQWLHDE